MRLGWPHGLFPSIRCCAYIDIAMTRTTQGVELRGVSRFMSVLKLVAASQEAGLRAAEIASELRLSYTTVHRILQALLREQAVERTSDGKRYCIGPEVSLLGLARTGHFPLRARAMENMLNIKSAFGETCYLTVRSQLDSVCIHREVGTSARKVLSIDVGSRRPMGVVIGSVAYLALLPAAMAEDIILINADRYPRHQLDAADVMKRVEQARKNGFAYADPGLQPRTRSVSVAIQGADGMPLGSLSVVAVTESMKQTRRDSIAKRLMAEAADISSRLQSTGS